MRRFLSLAVGTSKVRIEGRSSIYHCSLNGVESSAFVKRVRVAARNHDRGVERFWYFISLRNAVGWCLSFQMQINSLTPVLLQPHLAPRVVVVVASCGGIKEVTYARRHLLDVRSDSHSSPNAIGHGDGKRGRAGIQEADID